MSLTDILLNVSTLNLMNYKTYTGSIGFIYTKKKKKTYCLQNKAFDIRNNR
jgi:ribosomal protein L21E